MFKFFNAIGNFFAKLLGRNYTVNAKFEVGGNKIEIDDYQPFKDDNYKSVKINDVEIRKDRDWET